MLLWAVQRAAEIQCQAGALGGEDVAIDDATKRRCRDAVVDFDRGVPVARLLWDACVRRMRTRPGRSAA
jgi:hypothetical protein